MSPRKQRTRRDWSAFINSDSEDVEAYVESESETTDASPTYEHCVDYPLDRKRPSEQYFDELARKYAAEVAAELASEITFSDSKHHPTPEMDELVEPPTKQPRTDNDNQKTRKYALLLAYEGSNYAGLQIQPDVETVESVLHRALLDTDLYHPSKPCLQASRVSRAGRTDKGVSAAGNVLSGNFIETEPEIVRSLLNAHLPSDIRILNCTRVTPSFDARKSGTSRHYEYMMPEDVLKPSSADNWSLSDAGLEDFASLLQDFVGTHNFFNFTAQLGPTDPKCKRDILEVTVDRFQIPGVSIPFVIVKFHGRSFLLHQIRKMIGTAIAVSKCMLPRNYIKEALLAQKHLPTPKAPSEGLLLDYVEFYYYFEKFGDRVDDGFYNHEERLLFKKEVLYQSMAERILKNDVFGEFITSLNTDQLSLIFDDYMRNKEIKDELIKKKTVKLTAEQIAQMKASRPSN
ncbi:hypothetical protein GEMRC1_008774 [Eukaryota sp. GEM-RC1]